MVRIGQHPLTPPVISVLEANGCTGTHTSGVTVCMFKYNKETYVDIERAYLYCFILSPMNGHYIEWQILSELNVTARPPPHPQPPSPPPHRDFLLL